MVPHVLSEALKATDGDLELMRDVAETFLEEYPQLLAELEPAIEVGDAGIVRRISHTLKGSLRLFGDSRAKSFAEHLESAGHDQTLEGAIVSFRDLKESLLALHQQIRQALDGLGASAED